MVKKKIEGYMNDKEKYELERTDDPINYNSPNVSSNWQFNHTNFTNPPMVSVPIINPMVDSFCPPWDQNMNSQNLGFDNINPHNITSTSNILGIGKVGLFLPNTMIPPSLSHIPTDSGFIERAARFSCFGEVQFSNLANPFSMPELSSPHSRIGLAMQRAPEALSVEHRASEESPLKNEVKQGLGVSSNESAEAEFSGGGHDEQSILKGTFGSKKRKRSGQQEIEHDPVKEDPRQSGEAANDNTEIQQEGDQNPSFTTNKSKGKTGKQALDSGKDDYIHVRARRGQATNSHSLAERVRREKISERMKFLQDLVPGCSKVTGKAVMLDEIINYVQSLQRQVEFMSMKLATVNPRMDFNVEGLLTKDILQSRIGFSPDLSKSFNQLVQPGHILTDMANSSDTFRRTMNTHLASLSGGYKEPTPHQLPNAWEDELHNIVHMGFVPTTSAANTHDLNGSSDTDHMKA